MTDQLLDVLKIAFLALLYLFFLRVLWVVTTEVRATRATAAGLPPAPPEPPPVPPAGTGKAPRAPKATKGKRGNVARLVVLEPKARKGSSYALGKELTLGRSGGCTVQITDDAFVSGLHARVYHDEAGTTLVEDLDSTNGTFLNGERLTQPWPLVKGDRLQVGSTVLEVQ